MRSPSRWRLCYAKGDHHTRFIALGELHMLVSLGHAGRQPQPGRLDRSPDGGHAAGLLG